MPNSNDTDDFKQRWAELLPTFQNNFLKEVLKCIPIKRKNNVSVTFKFTVLPEMCNMFQTLHGGCAATLLDSLMSFMLVSDPGHPPPSHVTSDLDLNYLNSLRVGDEVILNARFLGQNAAGITVLDGQLVRAVDGSVCVDAKQTIMKVDKSTIDKKSNTVEEIPVDTVEISTPLTDSLTLRTSKFWKKTYSTNLFTKYPLMWTLISAVPGTYLFETKVTKAMTNTLGITHGGFIATAIDACTCSTALRNKRVYRVSVALHISYLAQSRIGDVLQLRTRTVKETASMATIQAVVSNKLTGVKVATGYQTVADVKPPKELVEYFEESKAHL